MARLSRCCPAGYTTHIIQRGNDRSACFARSRDYAVYLDCLRECAQTSDVAVHAWVLMTNHVHLLVTPTTNDGVSRMMQALGRRYVRYFNNTYRRTGTLWEGRFKSCLVQDKTHVLRCYRYIELNPVRARMVAAPGDYPWSSYRHNMLGETHSLCTPHVEYLGLGRTAAARLRNYELIFLTDAADIDIREIRESTNKGLALGSEPFKEQVERLHGRRLRAAPMGRPKCLL